jgi:serine/threonine protein kinase
VHPKTSDERGDFAWGLERFEQEAKTLARFRHRHLVQVRRFFRGNNTAYMVMDYEDGQPLSELIKGGRQLNEAEILQVLLPLLDGLEQVHAANVSHRDIKPANIYIRRQDVSPVLLDFGSARQAIGRRSKSLTNIVTPGYAPLEQYESEGEQGQGPWSDIYSLGALCYRLITGLTPPEATSRARAHVQGQEDPVRALTGNTPGYSRRFLQGVDHSLAMRTQARPQSIGAWCEELGLGTTGSAPRLEKKAKGFQGQFWRKVVGVSLLVVAVVSYMVWNQQRVEGEQHQQAFVELLQQADSAMLASKYADAERYISKAEALGLHPEQIKKFKKDMTRHREVARQQEEAAQAKLAKEVAERKLQEEMKRQQEAAAALQEAEAAALRKQEEEAAKAAQAKLAKLAREEAVRKLQKEMKSQQEAAAALQEAEAAALRKQEEEANKAAQAKQEREETKRKALEQAKLKEEEDRRLRDGGGRAAGAASAGDAGCGAAFFWLPLCW